MTLRPALKTLTVTAAALALSLTACSSTSVMTDHDSSADFASYKTFAWLERPEGEDADEALPKHLDIRLRRVVDDVLADKGFRPAPALPAADLLLAYYVGIKSELAVDYTTYGYYGAYRYGYWPGHSGFGMTSVRKYNTGTLVIDVVDRRTKQLVWTGVLSKAVSNPNPPGARVENTAKKLLKEFPPK